MTKKEIKEYRRLLNNWCIGTAFYTDKNIENLIKDIVDTYNNKN